jgi:hypothetical protein
MNAAKAVNKMVILNFLLLVRKNDVRSHLRSLTPHAHLIFFNSLLSVKAIKQFAFNPFALDEVIRHSLAEILALPGIPPASVSM